MRSVGKTWWKFFLVENLLWGGCLEAGEGCPGMAVLSLYGPSSPPGASFCGLVKFSLATAV